MSGTADGRTVAVESKRAIVELGGGFMRSREARAFGERVGLDGWQPYFRGRCGVLGEVDADVVAAAVAFFPGGVVRDAWDAGRAAVPAADAAAQYATVCRDWGRRKLSGLRRVERLAALLQRVSDGADVVGAPLFAGWRALPLPDDPPGRMAQLTQVLREHRGGMHAVAVVASGLTALEAIRASRPEDARFFGWPQPDPDPGDDVRRRRDRAEELTDDLVAPAYGVLDRSEADELVALLGEARAAAFPQPTTS